MGEFPVTESHCDRILRDIRDAGIPYRKKNELDDVMQDQLDDS